MIHPEDITDDLIDLFGKLIEQGNDNKLFADEIIAQILSHPHAIKLVLAGMESK